MNLKNANTEPYYRILRFHEASNRNLRVAAGALELLRKKSRREHAGTSAITVLPTGEEPWGKFTVWRDISSGNVIRESTRFLGQLGIMRAVSAFEDFLIGVEAEYSRAEAAGEKKEAMTREQDDENEPKLQLAQLCDRLKWDKSTGALSLK